MCEPVSIMTAAMSIGSAVMSHQQQANNAATQTAAYEQNKVSAMSSMRDTYSATQTRQGQEQQAAAEGMQDRAAMGRSQVASARTAAGEAGVAGYTVESILQDISGAATTDVLRTGQNRDMALQQLQQQQKGNRSSAMNQANSMTPGNAPSGLGLALGIAGGAAKGYGAYTDVTGKDPAGDYVKGLWGKGKTAISNKTPTAAV